MHPKYHLLIGFTAFFILVYFFNFPLIAGLIIFLSSVFIDIDHIIRYSWLEKNINPVKFWNYSMKKTRQWHSLSYSQKRKVKLSVFFSHGIEFWIIIIILAFSFSLFLWILIGIGIHMIADIASLIHYKDPLYSKLSIIYILISNKKKSDY